MDHGQFDELTRTVVTESGARRMILRFLAGSALGGVAARLGLSDVAEAKARKKKRKGRLEGEGKKKRKKHKKGKQHQQPGTDPGTGPGSNPGNNPGTDPGTGTGACPAAIHCQLLQVDTASATATIQPCQGDRGAPALCETALRDAHVTTLSQHLRTDGFNLSSDPGQPVEFFAVHDDEVPTEDVIILRFVKPGTGEGALLRFGVTPGAQQGSSYALLQHDGVPVSVVSVADNGTVVTAPVDEAAHRDQRHLARRSAGTAALSNPDDPNHYSGQADELCLECPLICKTGSSIECGLLVLSRSLNPVIALIAAKICEKPAEVLCGDYCQGIYGPLLEDDPKNCGKCGTTCPESFECCAGQCKDTRNDPQNCGACGARCVGATSTCCNGHCVDLDTDYLNCGRCGKFCGGYEQECRNGICHEPTCPPSRRCGWDYCCPEGTYCTGIGNMCCNEDLSKCQCTPGNTICNGQCRPDC